MSCTILFAQGQGPNNLDERYTTFLQIYERILASWTLY